MFQRFLDAADYWFGCSDDFSTGSYDPARECFMVAIGDLADGANVTGASDGEAPDPKDERTLEPRARCASHLANEGHRHQRATGSSTRARG
jgi:hypothetical protein